MCLYNSYGYVIPDAFKASAVQTNARDNIFRYAIATSLPSSWDLTSHRATKLKCLGYENACAFLDFCKPLTTFTSPDITLVTVMQFELLRPLRVGYFDKLQIMDKLNFLIEDLFAGVITTEELRF